MATKDELEFLKELASLPMTILVGGKAYKAGLVGPGAVAAAQHYVVAQRCKRYLATATVNEFLNPIHAEVIAKIQMTPISVNELVKDPDGALKLCEISLRKGGDWAGTIEELMAEIDPQSRNDFTLTLMIASGALKVVKKGDEKSDPTASTPGTKPPDETSQPKTGESG